MQTVITALLIVHGLFAVALIGSVTHQAVAATLKRVEFRARLRYGRIRASDPNLYTGPIAMLFLIVAVMGAVLYPQYRLVVRPLVQSMDLRAANGAFELKEHFSALGLLMLPAYWEAWKHTNAADYEIARLSLTWMLTGFVWWNFVTGQLLTVIKGLFA
jgi:hypothetical protein